MSDLYVYMTDDAAPFVFNMTPIEGPTTGGTTVVLTGEQLTGATGVDFAGTPAASFVVNSDSQITAVSPAHADTFAPVTVTSAAHGSFTFDTYFRFDATLIAPPPGFEPCLELTVPGFLADTLTADANGICYTTQALDGWFDGPPIRVGTLEAGELAGLAQGETVVVGRVNARTVDVQIVAHTLDRQTPLGNVLCFTAIDTVKDAFRAIYVPVFMDVIDPSGRERTLLARRVGPIKAQILGNGAAVLFNIPMLGEDPRLVTV